MEVSVIVAIIIIAIIIVELAVIFDPLDLDRFI